MVAPTDISGLVAWYSADYEAANYTDGQTMTQWTDLSGLNNHATALGSPLWHSAGGPAGGPRIAFNGGDSLFQLPSAILTGSAAGEIFAGLDSDSSNTSHWSFGSDVNNGDENHYTYSGTVYEGFGRPANSRVTWDGSTLAMGWGHYNVWSAANDWACRHGGVTKASTASNTVTWNTVPTIGAGRKNSAYDLVFNGSYSYVLLYNRQLTTTERADLDSWVSANPSGGSGAPSVVPALNWWDGAAIQPASLAGWWDGAAIQPASALGWWDGSAIQPLA